MSSSSPQIAQTRATADAPAPQGCAAGVVATGSRPLRPAIFRELPDELHDESRDAAPLRTAPGAEA